MAAITGRTPVMTRKLRYPAPYVPATASQKNIWIGARKRRAAVGVAGMSDVGTLSFEYKQAQSLSERIDAVLRATAADCVDRQEQLQLSLLLRGLVQLIDPLGAHPEDAGAALSVPVGLARRLRDQRDQLKDELPDLVVRLRDGMELGVDDVELLTRLKELTEHEASVVFRRMVRR